VGEKRRTDHIPPKPLRCSNSSISHCWPSGLGISCMNVFNAARPAVPAPTMATLLTCSVVVWISDVEGSSPRRKVRWRDPGYDSQSYRTEGVNHRHNTDIGRVEPWVIMSSFMLVVTKTRVPKFTYSYTTVRSHFPERSIFNVQ